MNHYDSRENSCNFCKPDTVTVTSLHKCPEYLPSFLSLDKSMQSRKKSPFAWNKTEINWPVGHDGQEGCILNSLTSPAAYQNEIHCTPGISQTRKTQPYIIIPSVINSKLQHPSPPPLSNPQAFDHCLCLAGGGSNHLLTT